ncbi:MAG: putative bifunctional diguanylate cyclase/phosphodiesterase [Hyphomicrobiaceae bacterium]
MLSPILSRVVRLTDKLLSSGNARDDRAEVSGLTEVVDVAIQRHDRVGEVSIGIAQASVAAFILSLHLISAVRHNFESLSFLVVTLLCLLTVSSIARIRLAQKPEFDDKAFSALTVVDGCVLVAVIWAFGVAYNLPPEASFKSPTIAFLFTFVAMRALRFSGKAVILSGVVVIAAWVGAIGLAHLLSSGLAVVTQYEQYLINNVLLVGAEVEKVVAILALAICVAIGARRGRGMVEDIVRSQADMQHMAHHDSLTGLPNRTLFNLRLDRAMARTRRGEPSAVLCLDLDRFKSVNDTLGHPVGDKLLQGVAQRIQSQIREIDTLARLGGDEFAIIQSSLDDPNAPARLAGRIIELLKQPFEIDGHVVVTNTSVGIAIAPLDGEKSDQLVKNADLALYRAKLDGRATYRFFEAAMDEEMQARREMELDLRAALALDQLAVHYQPLVDPKLGEVTGFEALIRWSHPTKGFVSPADFIPLAEEVGFIGEIGETVLRKACRDAMDWPQSISIAVNLSPKQIMDVNLCRTVRNVLCETGLPPSRLELEITETSLIQDSGKVAETLAQLRAIGIKISLDDFGTGYSSLSHLQNFPFDKVKVDRSFVDRIADEDDARSIVRAVLKLSNDLGLKTTAEGVEQEDQLEILQNEGVCEVQGYLYSAARPASDVPKLIQEISRKFAMPDAAA